MTYVKFNGHNHALNAIEKLFDEDFFAGRFTGGNSFPAVNIVENENDFTLEVAAPGREKEDFSINVEKDQLTVSYEKKETSETRENAKVVRKEFSLRSFKRTFTLDNKVNANAITARYENGVLKVTLPKSTEVKESARNISVL